MTYWLIAAGAAMAQATPATVAAPRLPTVAEMRANPQPAQTAPMAGDATIVAAIRKLEREWGQAFPNRDFAFLERIIAPEFRLASTGPQGNSSITSRADWMRNSRAFHHGAFADEVIDVMTAGDAAVALVRTSWTVQQFADRPAQARHGLCADTWLRRNGRWQVVYRNCNRLPQVSPSPPAAQKASR